MALLPNWGQLWLNLGQLAAQLLGQTYEPWVLVRLRLG